MATATAEPAPVTNGTATDPIADGTTQLNNSGTKRKREESTPIDSLSNNGAAGSLKGDKQSQLQESLKDMLKVLRKHDTKPSILEMSLASDAELTNSDEPSAKRTKLNDSTVTIAERIERNEYASLGALVEDVEGVIDQLLENVKTKEIELPQTQYGRPSSLTGDETRLWLSTTKFQTLLNALVQADNERQKLVNGGKRLLRNPESLKAEAAVKEEMVDLDEECKPVLTLFANALNPKQLFTSFQKKDPSNGILPPLRESGLPSFISTTNIAPFPSDDVKKPKKGPTFGELYGSSIEKHKLQPPKPAKSKLVTTGNTVEFVRVDGPVRPTRRNSYNFFTDKLIVGQWLSYGGVEMPTEPTSPLAKRKQRDRALSSGEAFLPPSDAEKEVLRKARNDALWRKCYSSFAPSYDDSTAIVPKDTRNEIWTAKVGERLAQKEVVVDPALLDAQTEGGAEDKKIELDVFKQFVDDFDPKLLEWDEQQKKADKEMDDVLQEVSELLETLASFQRIRNSSLSTSSRTTVGQNNPVTDLVGTPSAPSTAEVEIYKTLKLQLAVLVNQLPPYAVARLNGNQLEELNIKASIVIETEDCKGVMAEDEATRAAKLQAYAAVSGSSAARTPSSNAYSNYPASANQYNRTTVPPQSLRPSGPSGFYNTPSSQNQARPAPVAYSRSSSGLQNYSSNYAQPAANRPTYQNHSTPSTAARSTQYNTQTSQYYAGQNATANKSSYVQNYQQPATPSQPRPAYGTGTPISGYQSRPTSSTAPQYGGYNPTQVQSPHARTNSPQVPPQSQYSQPSRPAYSTQVPGSTSANFYRPTPVTAGQPAPQYANSYPASRMQGSASMTPSRQGSGTPQPAQSQTYGQTNGMTGSLPATVGQGSL